MGIEEKPIFELKKLGHRIHLATQELGRSRGIDFLAGPQGHAAFYLEGRMDQVTTIKDIEQELQISKSVASNLVKRMEKNGIVTIEASPQDGRSKHVLLTDKAKEQMGAIHDLFEEVDQCLMKDVTTEDYQIFLKVLEQFGSNIEQMKGYKHVEIV